MNEPKLHLILSYQQKNIIDFLAWLMILLISLCVLGGRQVENRCPR